MHCLTDLINQVTKFKNDAFHQMTPQNALISRPHAKDFPQIIGPGAEIRGVRRMYARLDEQRAAR